jgi:hypothetical protein
MKMLKEDLGFLALPALLLAGWIGSKLFPIKIAGQPEPNDNVIDAMNSIWKDKKFVKEFAEIIDDVGNYDQILQKINKSLSYKDKGSWNDSEKWWYQNWEKFKPDLTVSEIISQLEKTSQYKAMVKKYKFTRQDEAYFKKLMYVVITRSDIEEVAKDIILKTIEKRTKNPDVIRKKDLTRYWQGTGS